MTRRRAQALADALMRIMQIEADATRQAREG